MRFRLYPLSRAFSNRCVFDENAQRFSVDRRPKRIEMYAFSNENALVWTGPKKFFLDEQPPWHLPRLFRRELPQTEGKLEAAWVPLVGLRRNNSHITVTIQHFSIVRVLNFSKAERIFKENTYYFSHLQSGIENDKHTSQYLTCVVSFGIRFAMKQYSW